MKNHFGSMVSRLLPVILGRTHGLSFLLAVEFRNLVVHDATYLGGDKFPELIRACAEVLFALATLSGLPGKTITDTLNATFAKR